jgi:hypothetical protein
LKVVCAGAGNLVVGLPPATFQAMRQAHAELKQEPASEVECDGAHRQKIVDPAPAVVGTGVFKAALALRLEIAESAETRLAAEVDAQSRSNSPQIDVSIRCPSRPDPVRDRCHVERGGRSFRHPGVEPGR